MPDLGVGAAAERLVTRFTVKLVIRQLIYSPHSSINLYELHSIHKRLKTLQYVIIHDVIRFRCAAPLCHLPVVDHTCNGIVVGHASCNWNFFYPSSIIELSSCWINEEKTVFLFPFYKHYVSRGPLRFKSEDWIEARTIGSRLFYSILFQDSCSRKKATNIMIDYKILDPATAFVSEESLKEIYRKWNHYFSIQFFILFRRSSCNFSINGKSKNANIPILA